MSEIAEQGCKIVYFGLENYNNILLKMQKTKTPNTYLKQFNIDAKNTTANSILFETNILLGFPGATEKTMRENQRGIEKTLSEFPRSSVNLNLFRPLPDTIAGPQMCENNAPPHLVPEW